MKRNNIMPVGIVLILLFLTYNMAMVSEFNVGNDTGKTIVPWIQAAIAMLALLFSIYNMCQQRKATQRQVNLSLYKKRYKIRDKCIGSLDNLINVSLPTDYVEYERVYTQEKATENVNIIAKNNLVSNVENYFLLPEEMLKKLKEADDLSLKMCTWIKSGVSEESYNKNRKEVLHIQGQLQTLQKKLDDGFKDMLDFRKI